MSADVSTILLKKQTTTHNMFQTPSMTNTGQGVWGGGSAHIKNKNVKVINKFVQMCAKQQPSAVSLSQSDMPIF